MHITGSNEPVWIDSCSDPGVFFRQGWSSVDVAYSFTSQRPVGGVNTEIWSHIAQTTWKPDPAGPLAWIRQLPNGETEQLALSGPSPYDDSWNIEVRSTPVKPVWVCSSP